MRKHALHLVMKVALAAAIFFIAWVLMGIFNK